MSSGQGGAYLEHWGLGEAPFLLEPDPRFAYERADHREGLARMVFGLTQLGGLVLITGEIGCGKTMLAQSLQGMLAGGGMQVVQVANPPRTATALLSALLVAAGGEPASSAARAGARLRGMLAESADAGVRTVLAIDEAQRLDARALDELRLLTNPGEGPATPAVLLGQPELSARVARQPQVAQRVVVRYHLRPMGPDEVDAYVMHRVRVAGRLDRLFTARATRIVQEETGGVPRLVNLLCANALFVGAARGEDRVGADTIRDLVEDARRSATLADGTEAPE